ncbi:MAG: hypothetical protein P1Q69_19115, partial [Candidatus Thorarchaeota archaeon]|nr:hypothetical protein [Candidatus Thorarchaeota archaeon]
NISIPTGRDVQTISRPGTAPNNLTVLQWTYVTETAGLLNISASEITSNMKGYWRFVSYSANMVTATLVEDPETTSWVSDVNLRAGNTTRIQANVGVANAGAIANVTVFDPTGSIWYSENTTVDGMGYAESEYLNFDGMNSSAGQWMIQVSTNNWDLGGHWNDTGFYRREFTVTHSTELLITYPNDAVSTWETNATYGELVLIILEVNDTDSDILIQGGQLNYSIESTTGTFESLITGEYTAILNASSPTIPGKGQFTIDLDWTLSYFDGLIGAITLNVNYPSILTSPQYPGVSASVGTDQSFTMSFVNGNAGNGTGVVGATLTCNWTGPYTVTDNLDGTYDFLLDVTGLAIYEYTVIINASAPFVEPQTESMLVDITEIYTTKKISSNQLSIPIGESESFNVTWKETLSGDPITDGVSFITCDWHNYTISHTGGGIYNVTIKTSLSDTLTPDDEWVSLNFTMERVNYENHTFVVKLRVEKHQTELAFDDPTAQTSYGQNILVTVFFEDTDLKQGINNISGLVQVTVTSPGVTSLYYTSVSSVLGIGHYNITIPSNQWGTTGVKNLTILIEWLGTPEKYQSQILEDQVRILGTETDLSLELVPTATYYLNNFTFTVVFWDEINSTTISNSSYGGGNVLFSISPLTSGHPVTQANFQVAELGVTGIYEFRLNTSYFGDFGSFSFQIDFMWKSGSSPLYENQTMTVLLVILGRPTYVSPSPIQSAPYGESSVFEFGFIDSLSTTRIANSSSLSIDINEGYVSYVLTYDSTSRLFKLTIDTSSLGGLGAFALHLNITWDGEPFYKSIDSQSFTVSVVLRTTQLTHSSFAPGQWRDNVTIEFTYTDLVSGTTTGMSGTLSLNISS